MEKKFTKAVFGSNNGNNMLRMEMRCSSLEGTISKGNMLQMCEPTTLVSLSK